MPWKTDEWKGCYPSNWKGMIVPEAMAHPAKFSSKLVRRIYEHMRAEKWVKPGDRVIDPFGGVALGALDAMRLGLEWLGMELEVKFVDMGNHNISNWELKFGKSMPNWGSARLVQGDSRKMLEKLGCGRAALSSPPYAESLAREGVDADSRRQLAREKGLSNSEHVSPIDMERIGARNQEYGSTPGQLGGMKDDEDGRAEAMISSPPFGEVQGFHDKKFSDKWGPKQVRTVEPSDYGSTEGQLGGMDTGDFDVAISSPPFTESNADGGWQMLDKYAKEGKLTVKQAKGDPSKSFPSWAADRDTSYGETDGQLSKMDTGNFAEVMISSPPFGEAQKGSGIAKSVRGESDYPVAPGLARAKKAGRSAKGQGYQNQGNDPANLSGMKTENFAEAMISSPPYAETTITENSNFLSHGNGKQASELRQDGGDAYGSSDGQLGTMAAGNFDASISSPPFLQSEGGTPEPKPGGVIDEKLYARHAAGNSAAEGYGGADGQLGNMGEGDFAKVAMKSPPYADGSIHQGGKDRVIDNSMTEKYGKTKGQIGNDSDSDFWTAARQIVEQVYLALAPGGHAVWVVKNYVKKKEMVPFSDQWRQLCEAVGFETLHEHRALLVHATSFTLDGGEVHKESKSFFRRLAEKKGSPRIDHETVWCMIKPL